MSAIILNSGFEHPADGHYQIESAGEHPNSRAGVTQVIDSTAINSIANRFRSEADRPHFAGMLLDIEHFRHDPSKETRAFGWITNIQPRPDGLYATIKWSDTGRKAVDGGDYRFFSTEYELQDCQVLSPPGQQPQRIRPMRLAGATLTNCPNNQGQKPITNRNSNVIMSSQSSISAKRAEAINRVRIANRGMLYTTAWSTVRQTSPDLFSDQPGARFAATVQNRATEAPQQDLRAINDGINAIRASNPKISYGEARLRLRRVNPGVFGIDS